MKIKTSVALTTYNGRKYIEELLDSIFFQQEQPDEVVVVDDCSSDGTFEFVNEYISKKHLEHWRNYRNDENVGWRKNFRNAFRRCSGDIVFLCDQDDVWMPYKISEMKKIMSENECIQLLVSNYTEKNIDREEKVKVSGLNLDDGSVRNFSPNKYMFSVMRPGCTYCARKSLIDKLWCNDLPSMPHDAMLWGYAAISKSIYIFNRKTIAFRRHADSASSPKKSLCRTRRIEEILNAKKIAEFFSSECKNDIDSKRNIDMQIAFYDQRLAILKKKSLVRMIFFQMMNFSRYATLRNMLADDYILLFRRM